MAILYHWAVDSAFYQLLQTKSIDELISMKILYPDPCSDLAPSKDDQTDKAAHLHDMAYIKRRIN